MLQWKSIAWIIFHGKSITSVYASCCIVEAYNRIYEKIESIKNVCDFDEKEYVGNKCSSVAEWRGKVRREDYTGPNQLAFEGRMYSVPGNYVEYLKPLYGKNCTTELSPENKRVAKYTEVVYKYKE